MVTHFFFCIYFKLSIGVLKLYISFFLTSYFWTLKMSSFKEISSLTGWPATSLLNPSKLLFSSSISKGKNILKIIWIKFQKNIEWLSTYISFNILFHLYFFDGNHDFHFYENFDDFHYQSCLKKSFQKSRPNLIKLLSLD